MKSISRRWKSYVNRTKWRLREEFDCFAKLDIGGMRKTYFSSIKMTAKVIEFPLSEELYQAILQSIKRVSPARREAAKGATIGGVLGIPIVRWSAPSRIVAAAMFAGVDVRAIINALANDRQENEFGCGSSDDGIIYILCHAKNQIVKIGKTKALSASRAKNYTITHDDTDGWIIHHEVATRNVSAVEARIHARLKEYRTAYGYNAKGSRCTRRSRDESGIRRS